MDPTENPETKANSPASALHPKKLIKPLLIVAVLVAIALQLRYDWYLYKWSQPGQNTDNIVTLITQAIRAVNKPAVIEPVSKKIYLPDASIVLPPAPQNLGQGELLYQYLPSAGSEDSEAQVTLTNAVNASISKLESASISRRTWDTDPTSIFKYVPDAQACARGVHLVFGSKTKYDHLELSKKLADGRTLNIYTEKEKCSYNLQPLAEYLKQAQSY